MTDTSVYPRRMDFGVTPTGSRSVVQYVHLANYSTTAVLPVDDWGADGNFVSSGPGVTQLSPADMSVPKVTAPASGGNAWIACSDKYVFAGNTASGIGVFRIESDGSAVEVSRYGGLIPGSSGGQMYHDGRFLYVSHADGLHVFGIDQFGNLRLKSVYDPYSAGVVGVHGSGPYIHIVDSVRVETLTVDHLGQLTLVDSVAAPGSSDHLWSRDGWVFVVDLTSTALLAYKLDTAGRLELTDTYSVGSSYESPTGDQDYIYTLDATDGLSTFSVSESGQLVRENVEVFPAVGTRAVFFDGAYIHATNGSFIISYTVDRLTGITYSSLAEIAFVDKYRDMCFFDGKLIFAKSDEGIAVFGFEESRVEIPVTYTPCGYEHHEGEISIQGEIVKLTGNSPATFSPYVRATPESITLKGDTRWDRITFEFYGSFDRIEDVKNANPHIPPKIKNRLFVPSGSIIHKPAPPETEQSVIGAVEWRRP